MGTEQPESPNSMTRESCARVLLDALDRAGVRDGRIGMAELWPALSRWWSTPVNDLAPTHQDELNFLLSLAPADPVAGEAVFAGDAPPAISGLDVVCVEFGREFNERVGPNSAVGIAGGAAVAFWYAYDAPWQQLRQRSSWIEMGFGTPQIDAAADGRDPTGLIAYLEDESGVLETARASRPLALRMVSDEGDEELLVVGQRAAT